VHVDGLFLAQRVGREDDGRHGKDPAEDGAHAVEFGEKGETAEDLGGRALGLDRPDE
jgi:hypothetical protein